MFEKIKHVKDEKNYQVNYSNLKYDNKFLNLNMELYLEISG